LARFSATRSWIIAVTSASGRGLPLRPDEGARKGLSALSAISSPSDPRIREDIGVVETNLLGRQLIGMQTPADRRRADAWS
jgi:hypothetical protein